MLANSTNKELYSGVEFSTWLDREKLLPEEQYFITTYLDPNLKTVEAGVNGGRILFKMREMGFTSLAGFDYVPELIAAAISRDPDRTIDFHVGDAVALDYADNSFDQIIYLQQIICLIEAPNDRLKAIREAYRILKPGGMGVFSFLCFESRTAKPIYSLYLNYLKTLRKLRRVDLGIQYLPWLILGGKFNPGAIIDRAPYTYWYRISEIYELLTSAGFKIEAIGTEPQIASGKIPTTDRELSTSELAGMLYVAVRK